MKLTLHRLAANYSPMRILRLAFGLLFAVQAIRQHDWMIGLVGAFFLYQGITNTGCCGNSCATTPPPTIPKTMEIEYEEIK